MDQELGFNRQAGTLSLSGRFAEMDGIPVDDDGGGEVEDGHAVVPVLAGAVETGHALQMLRLGMFHPSVSVHPGMAGAVGKGTGIDPSLAMPPGRHREAVAGPFGCTSPCCPGPPCECP